MARIFEELYKDEVRSGNVGENIENPYFEQSTLEIQTPTSHFINDI